MSNKHTPGPWVLKHISGSNFAVQRFEIRSGSGMPHPIFNKDTNAIDGTSVCMSPQDACLIAAAPDLLEALESIDWDEYETNDASKAWGSVGVTTVQISAIKQAIASARGQS